MSGIAKGATKPDAGAEQHGLDISSAALHALYSIHQVLPLNAIEGVDAGAAAALKHARLKDSWFDIGETG
jgi:hypothetical protein